MRIECNMALTNLVWLAASLIPSAVAEFDDHVGRLSAGVVLRFQQRDRIDEFLRLAERGENVFLFQMLMVVFDEASHQFRRGEQ